MRNITVHSSSYSHSYGYHSSENSPGYDANKTVRYT